MLKKLNVWGQLKHFFDYISAAAIGFCDIECISILFLLEALFKHSHYIDWEHFVVLEDGHFKWHVEMFDRV